MLSDQMLLDTYIHANQVHCEIEFIEMLAHELQRRGLSAPDLELQLN